MNVPEVMRSRTSSSAPANSPPQRLLGGFTWEHPAHLYFRRAKSSELLLGGPAVCHERLLDRLGSLGAGRSAAA